MLIDKVKKRLEDVGRLNATFVVQSIIPEAITITINVGNQIC